MGGSRTFDIVSRLCATGHVMEAIEVRQGDARGYSFAVLGDFEIDALALFGELYERMRQGLARRYLRRRELGTPACARRLATAVVRWGGESKSL